MAQSRRAGRCSVFCGVLVQSSIRFFKSMYNTGIVLKTMRNVNVLKIRVSLSGLILLLQPALAFVWDVSFFQRPTTLVNWLGVLVALAAIYLGMAGQSASEDGTGDAG